MCERALRVGAHDGCFLFLALADVEHGYYEEDDDDGDDYEVVVEHAIGIAAVVGVVYWSCGRAIALRW